MILVTGAGGFIGHHVVKRLCAEGFVVRGTDQHLPVYEASPAQEFLLRDLRDYNQCYEVFRDVSEVYHLGADMGGIGYITSELAEVVQNNARMDLNVLKLASLYNVRLFYASSACVYPRGIQEAEDAPALAEPLAYPADPEPGYGWEKLFAEELCRYHAKDFGLTVRVARFHNVFGPLGTYDGGREKAPAALCRKIALAPPGGEVFVWGNGLQRRSFLYIDDCVEGVLRLMRSEVTQPINIGSEKAVTIWVLASLIGEIAGKSLRFVWEVDKPRGVGYRNSDSLLARCLLGWEPQVSLKDGLTTTYWWIVEQLKKEGRYASVSG